MGVSILECAAESWRVEGFDVFTFEGADCQGVNVVLSPEYGCFVEVVNSRGETVSATLQEHVLFSLGVRLVKELYCEENFV